MATMIFLLLAALAAIAALLSGRGREDELSDERVNAWFRDVRSTQVR